jgi:hypothetical protein
VRRFRNEATSGTTVHLPGECECEEREMGKIDEE